jgi:hypothetical protein
MKLIAMILIGLIINACGSDTTTVKLIPGPVGPQGVSGKNAKNGENGLNSFINTYRSNLIDPSICLTSSGVVVESGLDENKNNFLEVTEVSSLAFVCDGEQGTAGPTSPNSINEVIDPCGDAPGIFDEVLLRLESGVILASFSDNSSGLNTRFSVLEEGSYMTTDNSGCSFKVSGDGEVSF